MKYWTHFALLVCGAMVVQMEDREGDDRQRSMFIPMCLKSLAIGVTTAFTFLTMSFAAVGSFDCPRGAGMTSDKKNRKGESSLQALLQQLRRHPMVSSSDFLLAISLAIWIYLLVGGAVAVYVEDWEGDDGQAWSFSRLWLKALVIGVAVTITLFNILTVTVNRAVRYSGCLKGESNRRIRTSRRGMSQSYSRTKKEEREKRDVTSNFSEAVSLNDQRWTLILKQA